MSHIASSLSRSRPMHTRGAFTLIELLVVISIISMLIAITLPAYANDNRDWIPHAYSSRTYDKDPALRAAHWQIHWHSILLHLGYGGQVTLPSDYSTNGVGDAFLQGSRLFDCPTFDASVYQNMAPTRVRQAGNDYGLNGHISGYLQKQDRMDGGETNDRFTKRRRIFEILSPSQCIGVADIIDESTSGHNVIKSKGSHYLTGNYHNGSTTIMWMDGHARSVLDVVGTIQGDATWSYKDWAANTKSFID